MRQVSGFLVTVFLSACTSRVSSREIVNFVHAPRVIRLNVHAQFMELMELLWTKASIEATAEQPGLAKRTNVRALVIE